MADVPEKVIFGVAIAMSLWVVLLAGLALHEAYNRPGKTYRDFVKAFGWVSIGIAVVVGSVAAYFFSQEV